MNYQEYAPLAIRTAKFIDPITDLFHARVGLVTEVGEICDAFKKHIIYGKTLDLVNLREEIGDVFWYLNLLVHVEQSKPLQLFDFYPAPPTELSGKELQVFLLKMAETTGMVATGTCSPRYLQKQLEVLCLCFNINIEECLDINIAKLAARYGDKYSDYKAVNRDLTVERKLLEG
jgi:hypothetical protein